MILKIFTIKIFNDNVKFPFIKFLQPTLNKNKIRIKESENGIYFGEIYLTFYGQRIGYLWVIV